MTTISCPHCGFSKEVDRASIPADVRKVTCPSCKQGFSLDAGAPQEPSPEQPDAQEELSPDEAAEAPQELPPEQPVVVQESSPVEPPVGASPEAVSAAYMPKAGFWIRVMAALIDSIAITLVQVILGFLLGLFASTIGGFGGEEGQAFIGILAWCLGSALSVAYYVFFTGYCGQTPGKMALSIKVIRTDGSEIGYGRAAFREIVGKFVSGIIFGIGYLMVAFDAQKQGLHDKMADTYVVKI